MAEQNVYCMSKRQQWTWWACCVIVLEGIFMWQDIDAKGFPDVQFLCGIAMMAVPLAFKWALFSRCGCSECEAARTQDGGGK